MILFKITSCPDKNQVGVYQHESNELSFGNSDADMVIDDPEISDTQVSITYKKGQFFVTNLKVKVAVRLNGVQLSGKPSPVKSNDSLSMGATTIFFTQINDHPLPPPPRYVNEAAQTRFARVGSPENSILRALGQLSGEPVDVPSASNESGKSSEKNTGSVWTATTAMPPLPPKKG